MSDHETGRMPDAADDRPGRSIRSKWRLRRMGVAITISAAALALIIPRMSWANGGTLRLANVEMGEYRVSAFTDPTPVRPDSLDVSLLILQEGELGVAEGVDVRVRARGLEGQQPGETVIATRGQADDPRYYAAKFALGAEGRWEITVMVDGPAGAGEASFEVTAREAGLLGNPFVLSFLALLPLLLAAAWILRDDDRADPDEAPHHEAPHPDPPGAHGKEEGRLPR